jgi:hypothetical protein
MRNKDSRVSQIKTYIASFDGGRARLNRIHETYNQELKRIQTTKDNLEYTPNNR